MNDAGHPGRKYVRPDKACGTSGVLIGEGTRMGC
jgi:hypothetical protein